MQHVQSAQDSRGERVGDATLRRQAAHSRQERAAGPEEARKHHVAQNNVNSLSDIQKSGIRMLACLSGALWENLPMLSPGSWRFRAVFGDPWLVEASLNPHLCIHWPYSVSIFIFYSVMQTPVTGFRAHPKPIQFHLNYLCKLTLPK